MSAEQMRKALEKNFGEIPLPRNMKPRKPTEFTLDKEPVKTVGLKRVVSEKEAAILRNPTRD
jgi:hypothetical protein